MLTLDVTPDRLPFYHTLALEALEKFFEVERPEKGSWEFDNAYYHCRHMYMVLKSYAVPV